MQSQTTRGSTGRIGAGESASRDDRGLNRHVGAKISAARARLAMTQPIFAAHIDLTLPQLAAIERGEIHVAPGKLCDIADYIDEPIGYFFAPHAARAVIAAQVGRTRAI